MTKTQWKNGRKWIEALRSGKYKQAFGKLCRDGGYCCLGVAEHVILGRSREEMGDDMALSQKATAALGISRFGKLQESVDDYDYLDSLNDSTKYDFNQIADVLESQLYPPVYPGTSKSAPGSNAIPI